MHDWQIFWNYTFLSPLETDMHLHIMGCTGYITLHLHFLFYLIFALFTGFAPGRIILFTSKSPNYDSLSTINLTVPTLAQLYFN